MKKLENAFKNNANIGYIVAGYPSLEHTKQLLKEFDKSKLDILEIGIAYSDPIADGKVIQNAGFEALRNGINTDDVFALLQSVEVKKPLVFLVYYNLILAYGVKKFIKEAKKAKISGFIVPDLPYEENESLFNELKKEGIALIALISPSSFTRIEKITKRASGFIYCVAVVGITGGKKVAFSDLEKIIKKVKLHTNLPIAIGFGIKTKEDIKSLRSLADGVIVGTKIVEFCKEFPEDTMSKINELFA